MQFVDAPVDMSVEAVLWEKTSLVQKVFEDWKERATI